MKIAIFTCCDAAGRAHGDRKRESLFVDCRHKFSTKGCEDRLAGRQGGQQSFDVLL